MRAFAFCAAVSVMSMGFATSAYAQTVQAVKPSVDVKVIDGINHMGIVTHPKAISVIAEDIATRGAGQS